jgi:cysteinyl-tRNA synthetase
MARHWLHNGFLQVEGEKMSKSLGNFVTIRELLEGWHGRPWPGEVIRLAMLGTHYRQPIDWTRSALEEAEKVLDRWYQAETAPDEEAEADPEFLDALADDMNTPRAIARLHAIHAEMREAPSPQAEAEVKRHLKASAQMLGLLQQTSAEWFEAQYAAIDVDPGQVDALLSARLSARKAKNFAEADRIRDELAAMGIALKDGRDPTTGEPVTTWEVAR